MTAPPYDPTLKALVEIEPASWPAFLGRPTGPTRIIDADIATVSGAADKVLRVAADPPYLLHLEFVTGHDASVLPRKLCVRNGLLEERHDLGVRSAVLLLRPESDSPQLTGMYERSFPGEVPYLTFRYQVVRTWQLPPGPLLTGSLALLPLALISAVTKADLPRIIQKMGQRLSGRRRHAEQVWAAAYILSGLRYSPALSAELFRGVVSMKESSTYQAILAEGRAEGRAEGKAEGIARGRVAEAKAILRLQGEDAFGSPDEHTVAVIERLEDLAQLEALLKRIRGAGSWQELLGPVRPRSRSRRRPPSTLE
ncbi:MAG: hypothetical protein K2R98_07015 [Gemmataceae bacterium]|nr:hypothetical protein [Gemmataceae bacterium]